MTLLDEARDALSVAAARIEEARILPGGPDPANAAGAWKGLVATRWKLVDEFERDGKRYVVAQQNTPEVDAELSPRERAVVAAAAMGHHDKLIAYDLGVADSTVRVLMFRATRKLRAANRAEAIVRFRAMGAR